MSQQQAIAKCAEVLAKAHALYNVDLRHVHPTFNLRGGVAGYASRRGGHYGIRLNLDMLTRGDPEVLRDMLEDTIPHEIAHLICYARPELGRNHDAGWARVCRQLGGTGGRTHSMDVVFGRGATYEYTTDRAKTVRIGDRHHAYIQSGRPITFLRGKGTVRPHSGYSIVGMNGRSLQTPIVKNAVNHPAVIETAVRVPVQQPVRTVVQPEVRPVVQRASPGESKAATSRRIMLSGHRSGHSYEEIIAAMMFANGYDRQLARATYKANAPKVGLPVQ